MNVVFAASENFPRSRPVALAMSPARRNAPVGLGVDAKYCRYPPTGRCWAESDSQVRMAETVRRPRSTGPAATHAQVAAPMWLVDIPELFDRPVILHRCDRQGDWQ